MKYINPFVIGLLLTAGSIYNASAQTAPTADEVLANRQMVELGFLTSVSEKALEHIKLSDEKIAEIELRLADVQSRIPEGGTASEEELTAALVAAHLEVEAVLAEHLTEDQLAAIRDKTDLESVGKPETVGKPADKGKPL